MRLSSLQDASGFAFDGQGDGYHYPTNLPAGYPHLYVGATSSNRVRCVGAEITGRSPQRVATPKRVGVGDPVAKIRKIYGSRAHFVKAPTRGGLTDYAGYTVTSNHHTLVFFFPAGSKTILGIAGGPAGSTPNSCTG